jgi:hypothetical protein
MIFSTHFHTEKSPLNVLGGENIRVAVCLIIPDVVGVDLYVWAKV